MQSNKEAQSSDKVNIKTPNPMAQRKDNFRPTSAVYPELVAEG